MGRTGCERRLRLGLAALLTACLALTACGDDETTSTSTSTTGSTGSGGLTVTLDPAEAAPGDTVEASVVNDTDEEFTYGAAYELEVDSGGSWEPVELPVRPVPEIGYVAPAGGTGPPVEVKLPGDLAPGTYRVVIQRDVPGVGDLHGELVVTGEY